MAYHLGLIGYALDRPSGGIGRYSRELISSLSATGLDLTVLHAGGGVRGGSGSSLSLPGAGLLPGLLTLGQVEIGWLARQGQFDLLHDPTGALPVLLAGVPAIATIHDVIPYVYPHTSTLLDWLIYRLWLPLAVRRLDALITDSAQSRQDILRYLPVKEDKVTIIPAASGASYRPLSAAEYLPILQRLGLPQPYILYVGSIEPRKNLLRLLQAYAGLRQWCDKWPLVIVGARNFWKSTPVVQAVEQLNLKSSVIFTGFIQEEDLPAVYNGADCFIFPSLYEGFGLPVLEAMACGAPVITSNTSSLPEVAGEAALLVDPYQVEALTAAMRQVLSDPDLAADMRQRGLGWAQNFSWERTARETIAVYEQVLAKK